MKCIYFLAFSLLGLLMSCSEETAHNPKPRAYPKIEFPTGTSTNFHISNCPFSFTYPSYSTVAKDSMFFEERLQDECWFDVVTPSLNGRFHFSYYPITKHDDFEKLREDAFTLAGKHNTVAQYIEDKPIHVPEHNVQGFAFKLEGNVASPFQFYVTDTTKHFLRGALYVNSQPNPDSLAPIYDFLIDDAIKIINTIEWKS